MMENVQDIMSKIKFIASIRRDEKINVKQMTVQMKSLWTTLSRIFYQENRTHTLDFIVGTVQRAFDLLRSALLQHYDSNTKAPDAREEDVLSPTFCRHLSVDLRACVDALANLRYTYAHDRIFACSIHTLQELMVSKMAEVDRQFPRARLFSAVAPEMIPSTAAASAPAPLIVSPNFATTKTTIETANDRPNA